MEPVALPPVELPLAVDDPVLLEPPYVELLPVDPEPFRFWSVPFTSTRLSTSDAKFDALPVSRYVVPLDADELIEPPVLPAPPAVLPVALPAVLPVEPVVPVAEPVDPVDDEDPLDIDASVRI